MYFSLCVNYPLRSHKVTIAILGFQSELYHVVVSLSFLHSNHVIVMFPISAEQIFFQILRTPAAFIFRLRCPAWMYLICLLQFRVCCNTSLVQYNTCLLFCYFLAHVLFSALVGVFGGFLGCRLYRLGVFTIGECLGLVSSTQSFSWNIAWKLL